MKEEVNQIINYEELVELVHALMMIIRDNKDENVVYKAQCKLWGLLDLIEVPEVPKPTELEVVKEEN